MSAAEDDTELRDLLILSLENTGVLHRLKAEMRAAVFLAMEEQDKLENKSPLINENLKKCLNTRDGRLVASLIIDFLQVFNLDFSLNVFQPEINSLSGLDGRDQVCRDLGLSESEVNRNSPLLLEVIRRGRVKPAEGDRRGNVPKEPSQKQISVARKKFDFYDKDGSGSVAKEDVKNVFTDLFPTVNRVLLEQSLVEELRAAASNKIDFQMFVGFYRRLFSQCRSVVLQDSEEQLVSPAVSKIPRYRGGQSPSAAQEDGTSLAKGDFRQPGPRTASSSSSSSCSGSGLKKERLDLDLEVDDDPDDGDSFFDDPLPKPQKTYGCRPPPPGEKDSSEPEKVEASGARGSPAGSLSEAQRPGGGGGGGGGGSSASEQSNSRNGASNPRERGFRDSKALNDKTGSLHLEDDVEYDDDFNSHRSDLSKSELSIGEEIEEVSIEGPDHSDKFDETTQDLSVSQLSQSHGADYMEDVN
ncbi:FGFR1 oncogene partner isoform X5 [Centropristis striata]|uniref:FGFR1 oncogene partner isoform X5 n=1 Tax=Centropristis striata TaxID=184440 RepID=UPI0027DF0C82|nr:FGFR1 oncogene partner isoform X5 [Centropristis striata]